MSRNASPENKLGDLHVVVTEALIHGLEPKTAIIDEDGTEETYVDPRMLQMAITFLDKNKITCVATTDNPMGNLKKKMGKLKQPEFGGKVIPMNEDMVADG